jgi:hypothetical protein
MIALNLHSVEELFAGCVSDRDDRGVLHFPLHRNSIEPFLHGRDAADDPHAVLPTHLLLDDVGCGEQTAASLAEDLEQGAVVKLTDHRRTNVLGVKPVLEFPTERRGAVITAPVPVEAQIPAIGKAVLVVGQPDIANQQVR